MKAKEKLDKIYSRLNSYSPEPLEKDALIRNVMDMTSEPGSNKLISLIMNILFGWAEILWIRRGFIAISAGLIFAFIFQQFSIVSRIGQLESRMVESNTEQLIRQQGEHVLLNSVIIKEMEEDQLQDSIMVSDKDLRDLINSYSELQSRYQDLLRKNYSQQFDGNLKKQEL
jgi:hypothetical protein